ncbi:putative metal-dependent enzyme of the double-stranded beta helix superfamily [Frankia canadensis]|uniref:Putative metal-dependent enzyme of the double-stranded beta helix superfamily n=1 Tax=Frankia canadensis TaxID=1836972 RepID=A0A2I2KYY4_9ACTN|nr:cysteine dioxygenase family protein [Frankia canadensis]SNQ50868.1 putative metal-dependent enzyme of the double-stranded beta helix superfamily [Frankia canadensis]SOU58158.1 putative metal-dependent enzyme of the double-stranded beta helix superfamily [Frankia canadensis]
MPLLHPALLVAGTVPRPAPYLPAECLSDEPERLGLTALRRLASTLAAAPEVWRPVIRHHADRRWYTRLLLSASVEVWLIGWYPGQQTEVHDHGGALGALAVADGSVEEDQYDRRWRLTRVREHRGGATVGFGAAHIHRVANRGLTPATTIHAYSPPELPLRYGPSAGDATATAGIIGSQPTALIDPSRAETVAAGAAAR